jgi:hypothetical protein
MNMKIIGFIVGIFIAAAGGVFVYRALFLDASSGYIVTETEVHQLPSTARVIGGSILILLGAAIAFFSLKRRQM